MRASGHHWTTHVLVIATICLLPLAAWDLNGGTCSPGGGLVDALQNREGGKTPETCDPATGTLLGTGLAVLLWLGLMVLLYRVVMSRRRRPESGDPLDRLKKLGELRDSGVLTAEEFETRKAAVMAER